MSDQWSLGLSFLTIFALSDARTKLGAFFNLLLTRIIHERFYCNRGYAAATGRLAVQSLNILFTYASLLHGSACPSRHASTGYPLLINLQRVQRDEPS